MSRRIENDPPTGVPAQAWVRRTLAPLALALAAAGCANGSGDTATQPQGPVAYTVTLAPGQKLTLAPLALTLAYLQASDSRCPVGVTCVWAGHASIVLRVSQAGAMPAQVTLGTAAPPTMQLPFDATYQRYTLHLVDLERAPAPKATVRISTP